MAQPPQYHRRAVLGSAAAGTVAALAGCVGGDDTNGEDDTAAGGDTETDTGTSDPLPPDVSTRGVAYAFADNEIYIADPETGDTTELGGAPNAAWSDVFYGPEYLFAVESRLDQVHVIDLDDGAIIDVIDVGSGPTHGFYSELTDEAWVHSDEESTMYVIDGTDPAGVEATVSIADEGHGKPIAADDGRLFFSHMEEGGVFVLDITARTLEQHHTTDDGHQHAIEPLAADRSQPTLLHGDGPGTHFVHHAPLSDLVFLEEFGDGGHEHSSSTGEHAITHLHDDDDHGDDHHDDDHDDGHDHGSGDDRTVVVDPSDGSVVTEFAFAGGLYRSADTKLMAVLDGETVALVDGTSADPTVVDQLTVHGGPDVVRVTDDSIVAVTGSTAEVTIFDRDSQTEQGRIDLPGDSSPDPPAAVYNDRLITLGDDAVVFADLSAAEVATEITVADLRRVVYVPEEPTVGKDPRW